MIRGIHGLLYSSEPEAARAFIRDRLKLPFTDTGEGWLIFDLPEGDLGVHPTEGDPPGGTHDVSLYCDDIQATAAELRSRGVELEAIADRGYGLVTHFDIPGGIRVQLYEPRYQKRSATRESPRPRKRPAKASGRRSPPARRPPRKTAAKRSARSSKRR